MKVQNMISPNGDFVPNQIIVSTDEGTYFQSYQTIIAFKDKTGKVTLSPDWNYSKTTGKYRNMFLGETTSETRDKIKSGEYAIDENL